MTMDSALEGRVKLAILTAVAFAILGWDYFCLLQDEFRAYAYLYKHWRNPRPWMFIFIRYSGLVALFSNLFISCVHSQHCHTASGFYQAFAVLLMVFFGFAVILRVGAMWKYHADVTSTLAFLLLAVIGAWIAMASQTKTFIEPDALLNLSCQLGPFPTWFAASYAISLVFNLVAVSFAAVKTFAQSVRSEDQIVRDVRLLIYLIICTAASAALLVVSALGPEQHRNKQAASAFFILIISTLGSRIYQTYSPEGLESPVFKRFKRSDSRRTSASISFPTWNQTVSSGDTNLPPFRSSLLQENAMSPVTGIASPPPTENMSRTNSSGMLPQINHIQASSSPHPIARPQSHHQVHSVSRPVEDGGNAKAVQQSHIQTHSQRTPGVSPQTSLSGLNFSPVVFRDSEVLSPAPVVKKQKSNQSPVQSGQSSLPLRDAGRISRMKSGWVDDDE